MESADPESSEALYRPDEVEELFRVVTYPANDIPGYPKIRTSQPLLQAPLDMFLNAFGTPEQGLGELERFPSEILIQIIVELDLKACLAVRQTNRACRQLVTGLSEYHILVVGAFNVFDAVFGAGMAGRVTLHDLYRLLCEHECMICNSKHSSDDLRFFDSRAPKSKPKIAKGINAIDIYHASMNAVLDDLDSKTTKKKKKSGAAAAAGLVKGGSGGTAGGTMQQQQQQQQRQKQRQQRQQQQVLSCAGRFLFLPTMTRCCSSCLQESPRVNVLSVHQLCQQASLPRKAFESALCLGLALMGIPRDETVTKDAAARILLKAGYTPSTARAVLLGSGYRDESSWTGGIGHGGEQYVVEMPFLSPRDKKVSIGVICTGCKMAMERLYSKPKVTLEYTTPVYGSDKAFLDHFAHCPDAIKWWEGHKEHKARKAARSKK